MRWFPLTLRGVGALVLSIGCFVLARELGVTELLYIGFLLLALVVISVIVLHIGRRVDEATRTLTPDVIAVGETVHVRAAVSVRSVLPSAGTLWHDALPPGLLGTAEGHLPPTASWLRGGGRAATVEYDVTAGRRGIAMIGPLSLRTTDPFGLARRTHAVSGETRVIVVPTSVELSAVALSTGETGGSLHAATDHLGHGADNLVARPYISGDSMRRIHWRASAHRDTLMVRQEEQESSPEATVVFDRSATRWDGAAKTGAGDPGFEAALVACVSSVLQFSRDGFLVEILDSDGADLSDPIPGGEAPEDIETMLTHFATLTSRRDDHLASLRQQYTGIQTGPLVVIVGHFDETDAAAIAAVAHHSTLPILLAVSPTPGALEAATEHGWRTGRIGPDIDLAAVWAEATERGTRHVLV